MIGLEEFLVVGDFLLDETESLLDEQMILLLRVILFDPLDHQVGEHCDHVLSTGNPFLHLRAVETSQ